MSCQEKTMGRLLVAGGAGFIGSWLCESLLDAKHEVISLDNFGSGNPENISQLKGEFTSLEHDVRDPLKIDGEVDAVFHLASRASPFDYMNYPLDTLMTNAQGTFNLLMLAKEKGAKFLLASTSEVYGDPLEHPQKETYWGNVNSLGPRSCYDEAKRFAEALTMAFIRKHDVDARIVRIFNTYGPRMARDDGRVIPNFICQALEGKPLTVYGDGSQTRSFCYVTDMVGGLKKAMFSGSKGEVFNLGNPTENNILDVAKLVISLAGSDSKIVYKPLPQDDPARRQPDIGKAKERLGWGPTVDLEEGLKKTIGWLK